LYLLDASDASVSKFDLREAESILEAEGLRPYNRVASMSVFHEPLYCAETRCDPPLLL